MQIDRGNIGKVLVIGLSCIFFYHAWNLITFRKLLLESLLQEDVNFATRFNISNRTIKHWSLINKELRPLEKDVYKYKQIKMQHCQCNRTVKILKSENSTNVSFNDTTCSEEAFSRGNGQKVSKRGSLIGLLLNLLPMNPLCKLREQYNISHSNVLS